MNERIRELALQAGGNPNYKAFRGHFLPPPPDYIDPATVDLEKFAELIVRECAGIAAEQGDTAEHSFTATRAKWFRLGAIKSATMIKRTFGVEE